MGIETTQVPTVVPQFGDTLLLIRPATIPGGASQAFRLSLADLAAYFGTITGGVPAGALTDDQTGKLLVDDLTGKPLVADPIVATPTLTDNATGKTLVDDQTGKALVAG